MSNETKNKHTNTGKPNKSMIIIIVVIVLVFFSFVGLTIHKEMLFAIVMEPAYKAWGAGDYDSAISQLQSIETTHPKIASKYKYRIESKLSEVRNLKVIADKERIRGKEIAALVEVIKSSSGDNRQMMLKKLLELDPDTKEFPEEVKSILELEREKEARAAIAEKERKIREVKMTMRSHFAYDGSHIELTKVIKRSMLDSSTYRHLTTTIEIQSRNSILVKTRFSGENNVYTTVENTAEATLNSYGDIISCSIRGGAVIGGYWDVE